MAARLSTARRQVLHTRVADQRHPTPTTPAQPSVIVVPAKLVTRPHCVRSSLVCPRFQGIGGVGINSVRGAVGAGARNIVAVDPAEFKQARTRASRLPELLHHYRSGALKLAELAPKPTGWTRSTTASPTCSTARTSAASSTTPTTTTDSEAATAGSRADQPSLSLRNATSSLRRFRRSRDDQDAGGFDHRHQQGRVNLPAAQVGMSVAGIRSSQLPGVVAVQQIDATGDGLDPLDRVRTSPAAQVWQLSR